MNTMSLSFSYALFMWPTTCFLGSGVRAIAYSGVFILNIHDVNVMLCCYIRYK